MDVKLVKENLAKYMQKIKEEFPNYETRKEQSEMIRVLLNGMYLKKHILVEAGTGTGKSLAYILASLAVLEANSEKKTTIISTYTINLQKQLLEKDFPQLQKILGLDLKVALAKGRANYLCQNKVINSLNDLQGVFKSAEDALNFQDLLREVYQDGKIIIADKSEITTKVNATVWEELASSHETCLGEGCPYIGQCLFKKSRRELDDADYIISNHALFLTDTLIKANSVEAEAGILPEYDYVIFDEGHHLEDSATSVFSKELSKSIVARPVLWLRSILNRVMIRDSFDEAGYSIQEMTNLMQAVFANNDKLFAKFDSFLANQSSKKILSATSLENNLEEPLLNLIKAIEMASKIELADSLAKSELNKIQVSLEDLLADINFVLSADDSDFTYWVEESFGIKAYAAPLEVSNYLNKEIFSKDKIAIITSATLAVPDMSFFASRLGIKEYMQKIIKSGFDHQKQTKLVVPEYAIEPRYNQDDNYEKILVRIIKETREKIKGGIFVLFTSYKMLNEVYDLIKDDFTDMLYLQGTMPRNIILEKFSDHGEAILLGTSSFWEGVDVVGDKLRAVIITKLPFPVPKDPLIEARMQRIKENGGNSFIDFMLPQAVLQFKQGFGRLIRSKTDTGIVVVADKRIISKSYGKVFISSLPKINLYNNIEDIKSS